MRRVRFRTLGCYPLTGAIESDADDARRNDRRNARLDEVRAAGPADRPTTKRARWRRRSARAISDERRRLARRGAADPAPAHLRLGRRRQIDADRPPALRAAADLRRSTVGARSANSKKHGTTGEDIDFALLVDGLEAEREQGITIDVAYRYFATPARSFIVADTPGHEQYTRNMATGASNADLAVILVDARKGLLTQTFRHSYHRLAARHPPCRAGGQQDRSRRLRRDDVPRHRRELRGIRQAARLPLDRRRSRYRRASATTSPRAASRRRGIDGPHLLAPSRARRGRGGPPRGAVPPAGAMGQPAASRFSRLCRHDRQRRGPAGRRDRRRLLRPRSARSRASSPPTATSTRRAPARR